jgi:flagellar hook protein FlgE
MSFYTSLSGLKSAQTDLDVIAHNIANSETSGFKKSRVEFADVVVASAASAAGGAGIGARVESIDQDFAIGPVEQTGNALDLAIGGDGFFAAKSPTSGQMIYTRDGSFRQDTAGYLTDRDGNRVQMLASGGSTPSDALVPRTNASSSPLTGVAIGQDGAITGAYADGSTAVVGQVALAQFVAPTGLKSVGSANWQTTGRSGAATYGAPGSAAFGDLQTGARERSNVDLSDELVSLITAQRYFQANAKAVDTSTQIAQTIIGLRS